MSLEGRVAIVTGGGRGIGRAICLGLGTDGAQIAVNFRKDEEAARQTVADIEALGAKAVAYQGSVASTNVALSSIRWWRTSGMLTSW
jgi:3-oxoacyl-[acyl-carrier protein] reductase